MKEESSTSFCRGGYTWRECSTKLKKFGVIMFCTAGFIYQAVFFMNMYWTYPTVIEMNISSPRFVDLPAFTVCSGNGIKASEFCKKLPEHCATGEAYQTYCEDIGYCDEEKSQPLPLMPVTYPPNMTRKFYKALGARQWELLVTSYVNKRFQRLPFNLTWVGAVTREGYPTNCYVINSLWGDVNGEPRKFNRHHNLFYNTADNKTEYYDRSVPPRVYFGIHDPRSVINPMKQGFSIREGYIYNVEVKQTILNLLPYPFSTNCTDYRAKWKANGGKGPLTEAQCIEACINDVMIKELGFGNANHVPAEEDTMYSALSLDSRITDSIDYSKCYSECTPACKNYGEVRIHFRNFDVFTYTHLPKYENIEVFSYLGGYLGIWLGVSLMAVYDFFEALTNVVRRRWVHRRRPKTKINRMDNVGMFRKTFADIGEKFLPRIEHY